MNFTRLTENLKARGFAVSAFETARDATAYLNGAIDGKTVGFGGSVTLDKMGLYEVLATHNTCFWHWRERDGKSAKELRDAGNAAEVYLSSVNGMAESGEIINIDGTCNRVAATMYGHERVYLVLGKNKIAPTYEAALWRARNIAAPKNAQRLGVKTPCAVQGDRCYDCKSEGRICRALTVLWEKPNGMDVEIILINENLGY
ncbi:MAG: lactate utilization protein [Clostridia bacterium]|nr:lactate utilization protein [Clostridia bacterium]